MLRNRVLWPILGGALQIRSSNNPYSSCVKKSISPSLQVPKQACHTISEGYTYDSLIVMLFSGRAAAFKKQVEKDRSHSTQSFIGWFASSCWFICNLGVSWFLRLCSQTKTISTPPAFGAINPVAGLTWWPLSRSQKWLLAQCRDQQTPYGRQTSGQMSVNGPKKAWCFRKTVQQRGKEVRGWCI